MRICSKYPHAVLTCVFRVLQAKGSNQELLEESALEDTVTARRQRTGARRQRERDDHRQRSWQVPIVCFAINITNFGEEEEVASYSGLGMRLGGGRWDKVSLVPRLSRLDANGTGEPGIFCDVIT